MKILYIVPFVPWEWKVRSFNLIPRLARNHDVCLVCVSRSGPDSRQREWIKRYCKRMVHIRHQSWRAAVRCAGALVTATPLRIAFCRSGRAREIVDRLCHEWKPDIVYVERWRALGVVPTGLEVPLLCDPTDSMTLYNMRLLKGGSWWEKLLAWEEYSKFLRYEGKLARRADVTVFCSQLDMQCVRQQAPESEFELVPNGVDCSKYFFKSESEEEPRTLVFTGGFTYRPNCHAAKFFLGNVLPLIRRDIPDVKFVVVGNGARKALKDFCEPGLEVVDFVPDLRPYLAKAAIAVAPLTVGSGVSNKIAEGFAVGTPVIATPLACGDLPVRHGEHLLLARDANEFALSATKLMSDAAMRRQIALRARRFIETYDWEIVSQKMERVMRDLMNARSKDRDVCLTAMA